MTKDLNALIERLERSESLITELEAALEEWVFLYLWRVDGMNIEQASINAQVFVNQGIQALRDIQPVRDEEVQSRVLHSALISSFEEWTEPNEAATDLEAIRAAMREEDVCD